MVARQLHAVTPESARPVDGGEHENPADPPAAPVRMHVHRIRPRHVGLDTHSIVAPGLRGTLHRRVRPDGSAAPQRTGRVTPPPGTIAPPPLRSGAAGRGEGR